MLARDDSQIAASTREDGVVMKTFFDDVSPSGAHVVMGCASFPPNTSVPFAAHDADEYAYILSGRAKCKTKDGKEVTLEQGGVSFIRAGEVHSSYNDGDEAFGVLWILVKNR